MSAAIRRQVDVRRDTISFVRLMKKVKQQPTVVTRARYRTFSTTATEQFIEANFDRLVGVGRQTACASDVEADVQRLLTKAKNLKKYVDLRIAHRDKVRRATVPTFQDVDEAIDVLEELLKKYMNLFRSVGLASALPILTHDWKEIFRVAWIAS